MQLKLTFRSLGRVPCMFNWKNKLIHEDEIKWRKQPDGYALLSCKDTKVIKPFLKIQPKMENRIILVFRKKSLSSS